MSDGIIVSCYCTSSHRSSKQPGSRSPTAKENRPYHKLSPALRANIGKYACENGVCAAARHFSHRLEKSLNESTVRSIKKAYLIEVGQKRRSDETVIVLPPQKRGRPLLLGEKLDDQVQRYLKKVRECGGTVNTAITIAGAKGLLLKPLAPDNSSSPDKQRTNT